MNFTTDKPRILVVDDEFIVRKSLGEWLREEGFEVSEAASASEALESLCSVTPDIFLVDIRMPGMDGLELQRRLIEIQPKATVIIMTAFASVETAVQAMKMGAYDYIVKPFEPDTLDRLIQKAVESRQRQTEVGQEDVAKVKTPEVSLIAGESVGVRNIVSQIRTVAPRDTPVLIRGERGTGRRLIAKAIHGESSRRFLPFVQVNCGLEEEPLMESLLFGHEKGTFPGATYRRQGKLEVANGGTLYLDEIGALGLHTQAELVRALEEGQACRLGGSQAVPVNVRLLAATEYDLHEMVRQGAFREDLFYRLSVFEIDVPPLRDRKEDIPVLARKFLKEFADSIHRPPPRLDAATDRALQEYHWPGNVRELRSVIEHAVLTCEVGAVKPSDLPNFRDGYTSAAAFGETRSLAELEKAHIEDLLGRTNWNISQTARLLGIERVTLYNKIKKYGIKKNTTKVYR